jgi:hypothetical protein
VAATILRNTERLIRQGLRSEWQQSGRTDHLPDEEMMRLDCACQSDRQATVFGFPPGTDSDIATAMLCTVLASLIGADAELVIAVAVSSRAAGKAAG